MKIARYFIVRTIAVVAIVFLSNEIYKLTFWKSDINQHADVLENLWVIDPNTEAIYFGESSNYHVADNDTMKYRISHILNDLLPEINLSTVDNAGLHAGTYLALIKNIPESMPIKFLVITMNFRSFGANWRYAITENYLSKTELMLSSNIPILNKFRVSLKDYDYQTEQERKEQITNSWRKKINIPGFEFDNVISWDSAMAWHQWIGKNPDLTEQDIPLACHYIKNFAFEIDTNTNERIQDFDEIVDFADNRGYKVVFLLLDENTVEATKLVGDNLIHLMEKNRKLLVERYEKRGAIVVDNFYTIPDSCFVDRKWPTEHYSKFGKTLIAKRVKQKLRENYLLNTVSEE